MLNANLKTLSVVPVYRYQYFRHRSSSRKRAKTDGTHASERTHALLQRRLYRYPESQSRSSQHSHVVSVRFGGVNLQHLIPAASQNGSANRW